MFTTYRNPARPVRVLMALLGLILAACANLSGEPPIVATILPVTEVPDAGADAGFPAHAPDIASGARIYAENCAACHGDTGRGDGPVALANPDMNARDFLDPTRVRNQTPREWFTAITDGNIDRLMPPWGNTLSEQERWDVALYTYTLHYTAEMLAAGEQIYLECAECHGERGEADGPQADNVAIQVRDLTDQRAMTTLSDDQIYAMITQGSGDDMPSYAGLSEENRRAIVAYTRTLSLNREGVAAAPTAAPTPTTTDMTVNLSGTALLVQIHAVGDALEVVQALRIINSGALAFSSNTVLGGGEIAALVLTLPDGAALTSATGGVDLSADGRTVYVRDPLPPDAEQLYVLSYVLPYAVGTPITIPVDVALNGPVRVLTRPSAMIVHSPLLEPLGEQPIGEHLYNAYGTETPLEAGAVLAFTLTGTPDDAPALQPTEAPLPAMPLATGMTGVVTSNVLTPLLVLATVIITAAIILMAVRARPESPQARLDQIAREIDALDAAHAAGTLNHDVWHRQRAELRAEQRRLNGLGEGDDA